MEDQLAFNARAVFTWKSDRLYRVHLSGNELFFIRLGGQGGWREGALGGMHGHPLGLLLLPVVWLLDRWAEKKRKARMARSDARPPQLQVSRPLVFPTQRDTRKHRYFSKRVFCGHRKNY